MRLTKRLTAAVVNGVPRSVSKTCAISDAAYAAATKGRFNSLHRAGINVEAVGNLPRASMLLVGMACSLPRRLCRARRAAQAHASARVLPELFSFVQLPDGAGEIVFGESLRNIGVVQRRLPIATAISSASAATAASSPGSPAPAHRAIHQTRPRALAC